MKNKKLSLSDMELFALSQEIRRDVFKTCKEANSGHIGGSSGAVELLVTLYFGGFLNYQHQRFIDSERDRVLIRGHLGPLRYKIFSLLGYIDESELHSYRNFGSRLHGHEDHLETPGVDITPSGSLGMILSYGVGSAYAAKSANLPYTTYVFIGDGEEQEGNISEAARNAAHLKLNNLIVIVDQNQKQLSNSVNEVDSSDLATIWRGYGWKVINLQDGNDVSMVREAYNMANILSKETSMPVVIMVNTKKGKGISQCLEHFSGYHTISTCHNNDVDDAIKKVSETIQLVEEDLLSARNKIFAYKKSVYFSSLFKDSEFLPVKLDIKSSLTTVNNPDFCQLDYFRSLGDKVLLKEYNFDQIYFLTADVTRKDHVEKLGLERFCTFLNVGIREQHTISMAHGLSLSLPNSRIIVNSLDAFTYRSLDQLNSAVQGKSSMVIIGDVSGLTNSKNGKTHQSSGQPGALLMMPGISFLEPWDVIDTFNCLNWAIGESRGVVFIRIHSSDVKLVDTSNFVRNINWYVVHEPVLEPDLVIISSGLTVGESIEAANILERENIMVRVVNIINHKSLNNDFSRLIVGGKPVLTVYNGNTDVLRASVSMSLMEFGINIPSCIHGIGFDIGTTGDTENLLKKYNLDSISISKKAKALIL